ncbi:MAG: hypothetical protein IPM66_03360 [Acidobacteriota bacterium]|nr:MAG: hypothetical protein IPM66_03360 [Acidobacteriota bacterium]
MRRVAIHILALMIAFIPFVARSAEGGQNDDAFKFFGTISMLPAEGLIGDWLVGGKTIHVTANTRIEQEDGRVAVGAMVKVEGALQADGSINAREIEVEQGSVAGGALSKIYGLITKLPDSGLTGDWTVGTVVVHVTSTTKIEQRAGAPAIGIYVEVEGVRQGDGTFNAVKIETKLRSGNTSPTAGVSFKGVIEVLPADSGLIGEWQVGGKKVIVSAMTILKQEDGPFAVGAIVEVEGRVNADMSINAIKIETEDDSSGEVKFKGTVESLPSTPGRIGEWVISGRKVVVTAATEMRADGGQFAVGVFVEVEGLLQLDRSVLAKKIKLEDDHNVGGRPGFVKFYGIIEALPATGLIGTWVVSGRQVQVGSRTEIKQERGVVAVGSRVEVEGQSQNDGSVLAREIEVKGLFTGVGRVEFYGVIEALPETTGFVGVWTVSGRSVNVDATTRIKREYRPVAVGAIVEVKGTLQSDGSINAAVIEIKQGPGSGGFMTIASQSTSVSAANYLNTITADSIVAAFGTNLSSGQGAATTTPLPTELSGASVLVDGVPAGLFYVSQTQINYALPRGIAPGVTVVSVLRNGAVVSQGTIDVAEVAPSLFTANASGSGAPAGLIIRVKPNGQQIYESLVRFDATMNMLVPVTIQRNGEDRLFLVLFGSGFRNAPNNDGDRSNGVAESVELTIGGIPAPVLYAAGAPDFVSLDQINIEIPANAPAGQAVEVVLKVRDSLGQVNTANSVVIALQ